MQVRKFRHLLGFCAGSLMEARLRNECSLSPCAAEWVHTTIAYQGSGPRPAAALQPT